jgi:hypothetical protein
MKSTKLQGVGHFLQVMTESGKAGSGSDSEAVDGNETGAGNGKDERVEKPETETSATGKETLILPIGTSAVFTHLGNAGDGLKLTAAT